MDNVSKVIETASVSSSRLVDVAPESVSTKLDWVLSNPLGDDTAHSTSRGSVRSRVSTGALGHGASSLASRVVLSSEPTIFRPYLETEIELLRCDRRVPGPRPP